MFPTPVGMNRIILDELESQFDVPHTRGDEPTWCVLRFAGLECSPHPWG